MDGLGARLRAARLEAGLSQTQVEDRCGIPKARISRYENGHVEPSITSLLRLCPAIDTSPGWLLDGLEIEGVMPE